MPEADYNKLLDELFDKLPKKKVSNSRFEVPPADTVVAGSKTTIKNFDAICSYVRHKPADVAKYLLKELAVPGVVDGGKLVIQGKFSQRSVADRLNRYVTSRVLCKECGKPDTSLTPVERNVYSMQCEACGARSTVRN